MRKIIIFLFGLLIIFAPLEAKAVDVVEFYRFEGASGQDFTFTKNSNWQTVDISSLVTTDAIAAIITVQENGTALEVLGSRPIGSLLPRNINGLNESSNFVVPITWVGSAANIQCYSTDTGDTTWSVAGQFNAGFVVDPDETALSFTDNTWVTQTVNAQGSDSGNMDLAIIRWKQESTLNITGIRKVGETGWQKDTKGNYGEFHVVGVDSNDQFQIYREAPAKSEIVEGIVVGYILKGYGLVPVDYNDGEYNATVIDAWTDKDITSITASTARKAINTQWYDAATAGANWVTQGIREQDSPFTGGSRINLKGHMQSIGTEMNTAQEIATYSQQVTTDAYFGVTAYYDPSKDYLGNPPHTLTISNSTLSMSNASMKIGG